MSQTSQEMVCFEAGSPEGKECRLSIDGLGADLDALQRLKAAEIIDLQLRGQFLVIIGKGHVGLVVLPSGRRLAIRTKIPNIKILEWLVFLGEFPTLDKWLQESGVGTGDDFHVCVGALFLKELEELTRLHLRKDYMPVKTESSVVRGRILVSRLANQCQRLPQLPLSYRSRTLDTAYNSVLALVLDRLRFYTAAFQEADRARLARLRDMWVGIRRDLTDPVTAVVHSQWAYPPGYRNALQLARFILMGLSLESTSSMGGQAFVLSLAVVWERGLRQMLDILAPSIGWSSVPANERGRSWDDAYGKDEQSRRLMTDVMLEKKMERWVLDAKYKRSFGSESREDRFQMCAYALAFDANRVSLVYPTAVTSNCRPRVLLSTKIGTKLIVIDSIDLPMAAGPRQCMEALFEICQHEAGQT